MPFPLRAFSPGEFALSRQEARDVLEFFFPLDMPLSPEDLTFEDISFAQSILIAAEDESRREMSSETVPESGPPVNPVAAGFIKICKLVEKFDRRANPGWYQVRPSAEPAGPTEIREAARSDLAIRYRAIWISRLQGAPLL